MSIELYGAGTFAFGAGVATFFSPCSYALLPGYVGYYVAATDGDSPPLSGILAMGGAAAIGVFGVFLAIAAIAVAASDVIERSFPAIEFLVGILLIVLGAAVVTGRSGPIHVALPKRRSTILGFGLFGALYALAAIACVLPLFLSVALQSLTLASSETAIVLGSYAGSFGAMMIGSTLATAVGYDALTVRIAGRAATFTRLAGVVLALAGIGQLYVAFAA